MDIQFVDYDNVRFHLSTPESKTKILLSMGIQCWPDLVKYGARDHLQKEFEGMLLGEGETEPEYDVSVGVDLEGLPEGEGESGSHGLSLWWRRDTRKKRAQCGLGRANEGLMDSWDPIVNRRCVGGAVAFLRLEQGVEIWLSCLAEMVPPPISPIMPHAARS